MNIAQARQFLKEENVPEWLYCFGGLGGGECYGIEPSLIGWHVYFSERGSRRSVKEYESEEDAVKDFLTRIDRGLFWLEKRHLSRT